MKKIVIGIMPQEKIRKRVVAIAKGAYKPKLGEPKVLFTSMKSLAEVLSDKNRALLAIIQESQPESIAGLAAITGISPVL
jgi:predicted transcriptional regulator